MRAYFLPPRFYSQDYPLLGVKNKMVWPLHMHIWPEEGIAAKDHSVLDTWQRLCFTQPALSVCFVDTQLQIAKESSRQKRRIYAVFKGLARATEVRL